MSGKPFSRTCERARTAGLREVLDERGIKYSWAARQMGIWPARMTSVLQGTGTVCKSQAEALCEAIGVPFSLAFKSDHASDHAA